VKRYMIGICDDERGTCAEIERTVQAFFDDCRYGADIEVWESGEACCRYLDEGGTLDVLFLDIELPDISGIEAGLAIRAKCGDIRPQIIFISSKTGYALQLFRVHPYDFLIKPISDRTIADTLQRLLMLDEMDGREFRYSYRRIEKSVPFGRIMYLCSNDKKIEIHLSDGTVETYTAKLESEKPKLPSAFATASKSFVINMKYITTCGADRVELADGTCVNITHPNRETFRAAFIEYRNRG